jgi:trimethylamine--corrinoid protein Co-methyltransferase
MPGGRYAPLSRTQQGQIHQGVLRILEDTGLSGAPAETVRRVTTAGGALGEDGRLRFPESLVNQALAGMKRDFTLHGQAPEHCMTLSGPRVHMGSGGAAPTILDLDSRRYRPSTLSDLYDAARLVDALPNVHFFSRSLVARDIEGERNLDLHTAWACLKGTGKHVCVSAARAGHVEEIADICFRIAGSREAFVERPFLSLNINHVTPPLRFAADAVGVLETAARHGLPVHANVFGQLGASSPVSMAGSLAQTVAETLSGMIVAWLVNPDARILFGAKPMITDLRTGAMSGGGGEQAMIMAAATQMAQYYNLPNVSIAGAADSKIADAQSGYEKCLSVTLAAQAGSNLITQACGMQASLMGCALESYVIDNDMLGSILSSLRAFEVSPETLALSEIDRVVRTEGHFLGEAMTMARMKSDFHYPRIANRGPVAEWEAAGSPEIREVALMRCREVLRTHHPGHIDPGLSGEIESHFKLQPVHA